MAHNLKLKPRLTERLAELGQSQGWLARQLGISPCYINRLAQGEIIPKVSTALVIAGALQTSIEDLWEPEA